MSEKRTLQLDDLLQVEYLSSPAISPDGKTALYVVSVGDKHSGRFISKIWKADVENAISSPLYQESFQQKLPRFSPDGTAVYFLSDEDTPGVFQIWMDGTKGRQKLTTLRHGVSWFSVSPSGAQLAFEAPLWLEGTAPGDCRENALVEMSDRERKLWQQAKDRQPIIVEELMYKFDETFGIPDGSVSQLGFVDLTEMSEFQAPSIRLLTWGDKPCYQPVFSPDGTRLICWTRPYNGWKKTKQELALCTLDGKISLLTQDSFGLSEPPLWLDNHTVIFSGYQMKEDFFCGTYYRVSTDHSMVPEDGPSKVQEYFPHESSNWGPGALLTGHTAYGYPGDNACILEDYLYYMGVDHGSSGVYRMNPQESSDQLLTPDKCCVHGFSAASERLVYVKGTPEHIADLYCLELSTGEERLLARHNLWMDQVTMQMPQELFVPSPDGKSQIHGWVLKPAAFRESTLYPAVLNIHGGPECCYPYDWWFEFQYLSSRGMAVVWCDPHGSISYGPEYQKGAWDDIAYQDLMTFLDSAVELGFIDPARCGVTGGSYGGYMTNHIIGRTSRFAAAVSQRNLCNRATSYGTGDMGSIYDGPFRGCYASLIKRMEGGSTTLKSIDRITTPLLILHATRDYRCSFEQAEQMFIAMKDRRPEIPVRFAAFLGENHGLTRSGNMYSQRGHLLEMANWFALYLNGSHPSEPQEKEVR